MSPNKSVQVAKNTIPSFHHVNNLGRAENAMKPLGDHRSIKQLKTQVCGRDHPHSWTCPERIVMMHADNCTIPKSSSMIY